MIQAWLPALAGWDEDFDVDLTEGLWRGGTAPKSTGIFLEEWKHGL